MNKKKKKRDHVKRFTISMNPRLYALIKKEKNKSALIQEALMFYLQHYTNEKYAGE